MDPNELAFKTIAFVFIFVGYIGIAYTIESWWMNR